MPNGAYTPTFEIWKGGENITANFNNRAVSIEVDLVSGNGGGDTCSITVDDRDWLLATPHVGDGIEVYLGYKEVGTAFMGTFMVDSVKFTGLPKQITVRGNAVNFNGSIKSHVIKNLSNTTLQGVVEKVLEGTGLSAQVDSSFGSLQIPYMNVTTSPMNTIDSLCRQFGGIFKVTGNTVAIAKRDGNTSASGQSMGQIVLRPEHFAEWAVEHLTRHDFDKVTASYRDPTTNTTKDVTAETKSSGFLTQNGEAQGGDRVFRMKNIFPTKEQAQAAADGKQQELDDSLGQGQFRLAQGDPWVRDSTKLILQGFRPGINGTYVTDMVRHIFTKDGGLQTYIVTKPPQSGDSSGDTFAAGTLAPGVGQVVGDVLPNGGITTGQALPAGTADGSPAAQGQYPIGGA